MSFCILTLIISPGLPRIPPKNPAVAAMARRTGKSIGSPFGDILCLRICWCIITNHICLTLNFWVYLLWLPIRVATYTESEASTCVLLQLSFTSRKVARSQVAPSVHTRLQSRPIEMRIFHRNERCRNAVSQPSVLYAARLEPRGLY